MSKERQLESKQRASPAKRTKRDVAPRRSGTPQEHRDSWLFLTFVGPSPDEIEIDREIAGMVTRHGGNIVANDGIRHGDVVSVHVLVEGDDEVLGAIRGLTPMFASEFGVVGVAHYCSEVADSVQVRSQSNFRFSLHGRDYSGLLFDVHSEVRGAGFRVVRSHGRVQKLFTDEVPLASRDDPGAFIEYRLELILQPMDNANLKTLHRNFGKLSYEHGIMWSQV